LPKRHKITDKDSVEQIASNVQALIRFGTKHQDKLKEFMRNAKKKIQIKRDGGIVSESDDDDEAIGKTLKISELIQNAKTQEEKDRYRKMYQE
jgi:hypothetical protein